jgi:predicted Zn-dependent protease
MNRNPIIPTPNRRTSTGRASTRQTRRMRPALAALLGAVAILHAAPARAGCVFDQTVLRDAETEALLHDYSAPIFRAAGINPGGLNMYIINNSSFNAFLTDRRRMFINTGTLAQSRTPNELIGVIAHETGHFEGAHVAQLKSELERMRPASIIAILAGIGAAAAGQSGVGQAVIAGGQSAALRSMLYQRRIHELSADRAAERYLNATGQSVRGMVVTFERFADQAVLALRHADPYLLTHPLPNDRLSALREMKKSPYYNRKDPPELQLRHDLMRAKIFGFLERYDQVLRLYPRRNNSLPARYARAIAEFCANGTRAVPQIDELIRAQPNSPWFWELKGQTLLESARPREAIKPLEKAASLARNPGLIQIMLGQALIATNDRKSLPRAIQVLNQAVRLEPGASGAWRQLAIALGRNGERVRADLASAEASCIEGDTQSAKFHAGKVKRQVPNGSPLWLRADDLVQAKCAGPG